MPSGSWTRSLGRTSAALALAFALTPAVSHAASRPSVRDRHAIEHVLSALYRAFKDHAYGHVCQEYAPEDQRAFVVLAQHLRHPPKTSDCAHAMAAIEQAQRLDPFSGLGPPQFTRILVSGPYARVEVTDSAAGHAAKSATIMLVRGPSGWRLTLEFSSVKVTPVASAQAHAPLLRRG